jgi:hypothetical protein
MVLTMCWPGAVRLRLSAPHQAARSIELVHRGRQVIPRGRFVDLCCGQGIVAWCRQRRGEDEDGVALAVDIATPTVTPFNNESWT